MFSKGKTSITFQDILNKVAEIDILSYYLGVSEVPILIQSPLRKDDKPSFGFYSRDGSKIYYKDFSTNECGGVFDLLGLMWNCSYNEVLSRIQKDLPNLNGEGNVLKTNKSTRVYTNSSTTLECKVREWRDYDISYWESYGITLNLLKKAEVYPISHKIINRDSNRYVFVADKYAYVYIERKNNKISKKVYQPFNTKGFKWSSKFDSSIISLWKLLPESGDKVCICSSLKDSLCLMNNINVPCISLQGEGYTMSDTAINELKRRFKKVYILYDNDKAGIEDGIKLSKLTNFTNIELPQFIGGKDVSDLYKVKGKEEFIKIISPLFNN